MKKHKQKSGKDHTTKNGCRGGSEATATMFNSTGQRVGEFLRFAALVLLLACVAGRAFVGELPFRTNPVNVSAAIQKLAAETEAKNSLVWVEDQATSLVDNMELARVGFDLLLLAAGALWLMAGAAEGAIRVRHWLWGTAAIVFIGGSAVSIWAATDVRSAWLAWGDQAALLAAAFVAMQLCRDRRRFVLVVAVLGAVATVLAIKGLYQYCYEIPDQIADFEANRAEHLANLNVIPGSPKEEIITHRIYSRTTKGFFSLANLYAAEMVVLLAAAAGLCWAKISFARSRLTSEGQRAKGDIPAPVVAAILAGLVVLAGVAAFVMSRSRGGIGAAAVVIVTVAVLWRFRRWLVRHWRATAVAAIVVVVLMLAAVGTLGLTRDCLPMRTMTFRWFYWTGAAEIAAEHPLTGVGAGNFHNAYLRVRRPEAEEAVKTPHNFIAHALAQFGLPVGGLYIVLLIAAVVLAWRPGSGDESQIADGGGGGPGGGGASLVGVILLALVIAATAGVARWCFFTGCAGNEGVVIIECILPAALLAACFAAACWFGGRIDELPAGAIRVMRICLGAGAAAFVLHNLVSFGLWAPGPATAFWVAVGAAAGAAGRGGGREITLRRFRWLPAQTGIVAVIVVGILLAGPVCLRLAHTQRMVDEIRDCIARRGSVDKAIIAAGLAAQADPHDSYAAMNAAELITLVGTGKRDNSFLMKGDNKPEFWIAEAIRRNPRDSVAQQWAADLTRRGIGRFTGRDEGYAKVVQYLGRAVELDPSDGRLRLRYAEALLETGAAAKALTQIDAAEEINRRLTEFNPQSSWRFGPTERAEISRLRKTANDMVPTKR
ncbi:MAG: O-antigen ligase family protein [Phycisphaerae bacterium]|nr:O-antigen ligase family protein [Phycisphaerae bacterium]